MRRASSVVNVVLKPLDRRTAFRDLSKIPAKSRSAKSNTIQFYSAFPNIGNYTPVLGIQQMLGSKLDVWNIHDPAIDWDWLNKNYDSAIIGGAGLLNAVFDPFWKQYLHSCRLPTCIWGVGVCLPDNEELAGVDVATVKQVAQRCELINVRDTLTANKYGLDTASITACPTVPWVQSIRSELLKPGSTGYVVSSLHTELCTAGEHSRICEGLAAQGCKLVETINVQTRFNGICDILKLIANAQSVITTRLHGAIFAYSLGVPYIALSRDLKIEHFQKEYGGGLLADSIESIPQLLQSVPALNELPDVRQILEFGELVSGWLESLSGDKI